MADKIEDVVEDLTGKEIELNEVIDEAVDAVQDVVDDALDSVEEVVEETVDAIEEGATVEEALEVAKETAQEEANELIEAQKLAFQQMTVAQLKEHLKEAGLPISGNKAALIERLLNQ